MNKKTTLLSVAATFALGLTLLACQDHAPTAPILFAASLDGKSEKPASTTSLATGSFWGSLDPTSRVLSYTVTYQGFTEPLTGGHLHKITMPNGTGPIDVPFKSLTSPIIETSSVLRQGQVDSLLAGQYYANLHTRTYPAGEIRGEVRRQ